MDWFRTRDPNKARSLLDHIDHETSCRIRTSAGLSQDSARHILGSEVMQCRIVTFVDPASQILDHLDWLAQRTRGVDLCSSFRDAACRAAAVGQRPILLVDIKALGAMDQAVDTLVRYRAANPGHPVVIASGHFERHDFSCSRAPIADASLRLPVSRPQLALALGAAITNHRAVKDRLSTMLPVLRSSDRSAVSVNRFAQELGERVGTLH